VSDIIYCFDIYQSIQYETPKINLFIRLLRINFRFPQNHPSVILFPSQFVLQYFGNNVWTTVNTLFTSFALCLAGSVVKNAFYFCNFLPRQLHNLFRGSIRQMFVNMFLSNSNNIYKCINLSVRVRQPIRHVVLYSVYRDICISTQREF